MKSSFVKDFHVPREFMIKLKDIFKKARSSALFNPKTLSDTHFIKNAIWQLIYHGCITNELLVNADIAKHTLDHSFGIVDVDNQKMIIEIIRDIIRTNKYVRQQKAIQKALSELKKKKDYINSNSLINDHMPINSHDVKHYGSIPSPLKFVKDGIIDAYPINSITSKIKIFVGCAGNGTEIACFVEFLMKLEIMLNEFPDEKHRHNHIVSKMLFACENNPACVVLLKKQFPHLQIYETSIFTLIQSDEERKKFFGGDGKVNAFICHPPFEKSQHKIPKEDDSRKRGGSNFCWDLIKAVKKHKLLAPNAYIAMIIPRGWRQPAIKSQRGVYGLFNYMAHEMTPIAIKMMSGNYTKNSFNHKVSLKGVDIYCAINKANNTGHQTKLHIGDDGQDNLINLSNWEFLPNGGFDTHNGVVLDHRARRISTSNGYLHAPNSYYDLRESHWKNGQYSETSTPEHKYMIMETLSSKDTHQPKHVYTKHINKNHKKYIDEKKPKLLFQRYGNLHVLEDPENKYLLSGQVGAIFFDNIEDMKRALEFFKRQDIKKMFDKDLMFSMADPNQSRLFHMLRKDFFKH